MTIAFSLGLSARMRSTTDVITSTHENRLARMPAASSTALALHNSSAMSHSFSLMVGRPHALSMPMRAARHNWLRRVHAMLGPCITGLAAWSFVVALPTIASALGGDIVVGAAHGGCCGDVTRRGQAPLRREA